MICHECKKNKLAKEFPYEHLTEECIKHPLLHCLRCMTASVTDRNKCSQCDVVITRDNEKYKEYVDTLKILFPTVSASDEALISTDDESVSHIFITTLSEKCISIAYNPEKTIADVKKFIEKELKTPCAKQCLLYNDTELKTKGNGNKDDRKLKDYDVKPNSTIYLLVLLFGIPEDYDKMLFCLAWGYPESGRDYLDASVFLYSGSTFKDVVNYKDGERKSCWGVTHCGDTMDDNDRMGSHEIMVSVKDIPTTINLLVFTLSAWSSKDISAYPNISLKLVDERCPEKSLCDDKIEDVVHSKAIVICYLFKQDGKWNVVSVKRPSDGCVKDYDPLKENISECVLFKELAKQYESKKSRCSIL